MDICGDANLLKIWRFIGILIDIARIAVPIILVVMGSLDFAKAVIASKEDDIKKSQGLFVKRLIAGVIVFFIPYVVRILLTLLEVSTSPCLECVINVSNCP